MMKPLQSLQNASKNCPQNLLPNLSHFFTKPLAKSFAKSTTKDCKVPTKPLQNHKNPSKIYDFDKILVSKFLSIKLFSASFFSAIVSTSFVATISAATPDADSLKVDSFIPPPHRYNPY